MEFIASLLWATPAAKHFHLTSPKTKIIQKVSVFWMDNDVSSKLHVQISKNNGSPLGHQNHFKIKRWFLILGSILLSLFATFFATGMPAQTPVTSAPTIEKYPIFRTQPNLSLANLTSICLLLLSLLFLVVVHLPVVSTKILIISSGW